MCTGLSVDRRAIPAELIQKYRLEDSIAKRSANADDEIQFHFNAPKALLPVQHGNRLDICEWGNRDNKMSRLPRTGWANIESVESGKWKYMKPEEVIIPASIGFDKGIWFQITEGIKGIMVKDEAGKPHLYMLTQAASHYYKVMTRNDREPIFVGEQI